MTAPLGARPLTRDEFSALTAQLGEAVESIENLAANLDRHLESGGGLTLAEYGETSLAALTIMRDAESLGRYADQILCNSEALVLTARARGLT